MASETCLFPWCQEKGPNQTFRVQGINTIIQSSKARGDDDVHVTLQAILDSQGENSSIQCHKLCYCTYTSKSNLKYVAKRRNEGVFPEDNEPPVRRVRRSQLPTFQFNKHCLLCGYKCDAKDPKHPDRWKRVVQCETSDRPGLTPFKDTLLDICEQRNDDFGRRVELRIKGAFTDLPAADAQYHKQCYDDFKVIPKYTDLSNNSDLLDDDALNLVINEMYANQHETWTTIDLHDMYTGFGGLLSRKHMLSKMTEHLGNDIMVVRMDGCASVVGFKNTVGMSLKLVKVDAVDEESVDTVLRQVRGEARAIQYTNANYDLGEFTNSNTIKSTSKTLLKIIWPHGGDASVLVESIKGRLSCYPAGTEKILVFDKYDDLSAKDHERMRRAGEGSTDYNLTTSSPLPHRDAVLKNKHNKQELSRVLSTFNLGADVSTETRDYGGFAHDEADVTMMTYLLQAAECGKRVIRILSDDTDVFVLLLFWVWKMMLYHTCSVQMEHWNGVVLDINATCMLLGSKCLQLLGMHALSGCDTVSYPFNKGKISALNALQAGDFPGLFGVLGEEGATEGDLMKTGLQFFAAIYGQPPETAMSVARYRIYSRKKGKPVRIMALPPTDINLYFHVQRAYLQVMLWKAADQQSPPKVDITQFGWEVKAGIPSPRFDTGPPAPPDLIDVISCGCKAEGKACTTESCSCHGHQISCTVYCACASGDGCCNPLTIRDDAGDNDVVHETAVESEEDEEEDIR